MTPLQLLQLLQNSGNPIQILQNLATNDPQIAQVLTMAQSGNIHTVIQNVAKERGIPIEQLQQLASQCGYTL